MQQLFQVVYVAARHKAVYFFSHICFIFVLCDGIVNKDFDTANLVNLFIIQQKSVYIFISDFEVQNNCSNFSFQNISFMRKFLLTVSLFPVALMAFCEVPDWHVVRSHPQKHFLNTIPPGNYSGIANMGGDVYAMVSDKSDSAL